MSAGGARGGNHPLVILRPVGLRLADRRLVRVGASRTRPRKLSADSSETRYLAGTRDTFRDAD